MKEILAENKLDFELFMGSDGLDIIKYALNHEKKYGLIKCIVTDENMEYFNGSEAISFIRKFEKKKNLIQTKVITMTCHEDYKIYDSIKNSGVDFVLTKPVNKSTFFFSLKKIGIINNPQIYKKH